MHGRCGARFACSACGAVSLVPREADTRLRRGVSVSITPIDKICIVVAKGTPGTREPTEVQPIDVGISSAVTPHSVCGAVPGACCASTGEQGLRAFKACHTSAPAFIVSWVACTGAGIQCGGPAAGAAEVRVRWTRGAACSARGQYQVLQEHVRVSDMQVPGQ